VRRFRDRRRLVAADVAQHAQCFPGSEAFAEIVASCQSGELLALDQKTFRDRHVQPARHGGDDCALGYRTKN
jgi:hypothetical protein